VPAAPVTGEELRARGPSRSRAATPCGPCPAERSAFVPGKLPAHLGRPSRRCGRRSASLHLAPLTVCAPKAWLPLVHREPANVARSPIVFHAALHDAAPERKSRRCAEELLEAGRAGSGLRISGGGRSGRSRTAWFARVNRRRERRPARDRCRARFVRRSICSDAPAALPRESRRRTRRPATEPGSSCGSPGRERRSETVVSRVQRTRQEPAGLCPSPSDTAGAGRGRDTAGNRQCCEAPRNPEDPLRGAHAGSVPGGGALGMRARRTKSDPRDEARRSRSRSPRRPAAPEGPKRLDQRHRTPRSSRAAQRRPQRGTTVGGRGARRDRRRESAPARTQTAPGSNRSNGVRARR